MKKSNLKCLVAVFLSFAILLSLCNSIDVPCSEAKTTTALCNPIIDNDGVATWDCIYFGNYYQSNNKTKDPIKWRILSVNENDAFLLADQNLDVQPYHEELASVTWETCTLRIWLNSFFLSTAFTSEEQAAIRTTKVINDNNPMNWATAGGNNTSDKIYLLSIAEASNKAYGFDREFLEESESRVATNTAYTASQNAYMNSAGSADWWWLRTPGFVDIYASDIGSDGYGNDAGYSVNSFRYAIRPVLHLNLSNSTLWRYAGKITTNGKIPATVKITSVKNQKGKRIFVKWKKVKGVKRYQIQYATNKKFKRKKSIYTKKKTITIRKLKKKKTYYIRVRAYKQKGKKKVYGKWSTVKKVKIKK